jgi:hypothetical protein
VGSDDVAHLSGAGALAENTDHLGGAGAGIVGDLDEGFHLDHGGKSVSGEWIGRTGLKLI